MNVRLAPFNPKGTLDAQPSKSDGHRKIICGAFAANNCIIENLVLSEDISATIEALKSAGCSINIVDSNRYHNRKTALMGGFKKDTSNKRSIDCRESGSTLRFMAMIFSAIGGETILSGSGRLPERPMQHALEFFDKYGMTYSVPGDGRYLPMKFSGNLKGNDFEIDSSVSSQFISGLMMGMAAASMKGEIIATGKFESRGYVDLTKGVLSDFGIRVEGNNPYVLDASCGLHADEITVEGDWSNASYFLAMNHMGGQISLKGLNKKSYQPDRIIEDILINMSGVCDNYIDASEFPDLMPTIAIYAATLPVNTTITGQRLRYKESDRIGSVCHGLESLGIKAAELKDGLIITGKKQIKGGKINSFNDHRIAMAFSTLSCVSAEDIIIENAGCIDKSYPDFFKDIIKVGGRIS
ncbi:MAG: 3-phosphoshikimate 1-carboxyvinyltransferase [Clostridia bacterium]|nr:3-phosphoshikimate 1-carboxyvinyltransferase [Clostridia bacterium]MBN2882351.1 3-phosphoshikimate 1-carboxyvinyltransferase [Clostridia bacterium]